MTVVLISRVTESGNVRPMDDGLEVTHSVKVCHVNCRLFSDYALFLIISGRIITCQRLIDPRNGDVNLSGLKVGSKATYSCDRGFQLRGNQVRKCQANGQWSGRNPFCQSTGYKLHADSSLRGYQFLYFRENHNLSEIE